MLPCSTPRGARRGEVKEHLDAHRQRYTAAHCLLAYLCMVNHGAHGGEIYITPKHTETHCYIPPLHRHTMHTHTHTHTRTNGQRKRRVVVKSGNIKVDLRSGAAASQERTRTHARTSNRILYTFPCLLCVLFRVLLFAVPMPFSDVVLPCFLTVWCVLPVCGGVVCFVFLLSVSVFIYVLGCFCQICTYSLRQRIENGV